MTSWSVHKLCKATSVKLHSSLAVYLLAAHFTKANPLPCSPNSTLVYPTAPLPLGEVTSGFLKFQRVDYLIAVGMGSNATLLWNSATGVWTQSAVRKYPGHHHAPVVYKNKLYLLGGVTGKSAGKTQIATLYRDTTTRLVQVKWTLGPDIPVVTGSAVAAVIKDKMYYCSGLAMPLSYLNNTIDTCAIFTPDATGFKGTWSTSMSPMLDGGRNHAFTCTDGNRMFAFGGRNNVSLAIGESQVYDPVTNTWLMSGSPGAPPPLPVPRSGGGAAVFSRGKCFAFGGEINSRVANATTGLTDLGTFVRVDVFDVASNTWTVGRDLPFGIHGISPTTASPDSCAAHIVGGGPKVALSFSDTHLIYHLAA